MIYVVFLYGSELKRTVMTSRFSLNFATSGVFRKLTSMPKGIRAI